MTACWRAGSSGAARRRQQLLRSSQRWYLQRQQSSFVVTQQEVASLLSGAAGGKAQAGRQHGSALSNTPARRNHFAFVGRVGPSGCRQEESAGIVAGGRCARCASATTLFCAFTDTHTSEASQSSAAAHSTMFGYGDVFGYGGYGDGAYHWGNRRERVRRERLHAEHWLPPLRQS